MLLHFGNDLQSEGGFAGRLRAVNFDDPTARQAAHAQRDVQAQRAGGDDLDVLDRLALTQAHDGALAKLLFNLGQRGLQGFGFFGVGGLVFQCGFHGNLLEDQRVVVSFAPGLKHRLDA